MTDVGFPSNLEHHLVAPDEGLYPTGGDPADRILGSVVGRGPADYSQSDTVLLGVPQDVGVRRNGGRPGARLAPPEIRRWLYRYPAPSPVGDRALCDLGDLKVNGSLEEIHQRQKKIVATVLGSGRRIIVLGGGNDISYPDAGALATIDPEVTAFNVDSHFDVRLNDIRHSGTPYRQLLDEGILKPEHFYVLGCKPEANSPEYASYLRKIGANIFWLEDLRERGIDNLIEDLLKQISPGLLFWGLDLDVVRSSDAPGVSMTYPVGLTAEEICTVAAVAGQDSRTRILELSEVNPEHDLDHRTSRLAAQAIIHFLNSTPSTPPPPG